MTNNALMWADVVCRQADEAQRNGDLSLVNGLGKNAAMLYYFTNVYMLRSVRRESFSMYYPGMVKEIERLYAEYERDAKIAEATQTIAKSDERITTIEATLQQLVEAVQGIAGQIAVKPEESPVSPETDVNPDKKTAEESDISKAMEEEPKQERKRSKG